MVWTCGRRKTTNDGFTWTRGGKEKQREAKEDLDGQCQGRPEREKHRLDQDWRGDGFTWTRGGKERNREVWRSLVRASSSAC